ncbi:MAG: carboxypeptidase-like regulatory domain-containing protein [Planctomycetota bacterium]
MTKKPLIRTALTLVPCLAFLAPARADTVTGQVVDPLGKGVVGVKLVFKNATPVNPITGLGGFFSVVVPPRTYDIGFNPPTTTLAPTERLGVVVSGFTNMGVIKLQKGFPISGTVVDPTRLPVPLANIDVIDQATSKTLYTPNDGTNLFGQFAVVVPAGKYRVRVFPPVSKLLVMTEIPNVAVSAPVSLGTIVLKAGVIVSGIVVDALLKTPISTVDLDIDDARTKQRLNVPNDFTNALGQFSIVLAPGLYHISFAPPATTNYVGLRMFNVAVSTTKSLGTIGLKRGVVLSGTVLGPALVPVVNADLDVDTSPGDVRIYTPHDNTDRSGKFSVVIPQGTFKLTVEPPFGLPLVGMQTAAFTVNANTVLPTINLASGVVLGGTLTGWNNQPEYDADIDVINPTTGVEVITPRDNTSASGQFAVIIPKGTWNVRFETRKASLSAVQTLTNVVVTGPRVLNHKLPLVKVATFLGTAGIPTVPRGGPVPLDLAFGNTSTTQIVNTTVSMVLIDPLKNEKVIMPPLKIPLWPFAWGILPGLLFPIPHINPAHSGLPHRVEIRWADATTGVIFDSDHVKIIAL